MVWVARQAAPTPSTPRPGHPPLHGQGLPQERREHGVLVVVRQQEDALGEEAPHLRVVHHGQVHQDGAQDLGHLGGGGGITGAAWPSGASCPRPSAHPSSGDCRPTGQRAGHAASAPSGNPLAFPGLHRVSGVGSTALWESPPSVS